MVGERGQEHLELLRLAFTVCSRVGATLDQRLRSAHGISLAEFEILSALRSGPSGGIRMTTLAAAASISKSRLSHCVDRLTAVDYVARHHVDEDGRGRRTVLTDPGRKVCEEGTTTHRLVCREVFYDIFADDEVTDLAGKCRKILGRDLKLRPYFS